MAGKWFNGLRAQIPIRGDGSLKYWFNGLPVSRSTVALIYLYPDADSSTGGWTASGGGALYAAIDEIVADDADYIQSGDDPVNDIAKIGLSDSVTTLGTPITAYIRYKCRNAVTLLNLRVRLLQGTTEIASWTYATSTSAVTATEALTAPQIASISDQTDLYFEFTANP